MAEKTLINDLVLKRHKRLLDSNLRYLQKEVENIIDDLAAETGSTRNEIRKIVTSPYIMLKDIRQSEEFKCDADNGFPALRIPYLGIFSARESYIDRFIKRKKGETNGTVRVEQ